MKPSIPLTILTGLSVVGAAPAKIEGRQQETTSNDLKDGACKPVTFIMARGSTEVGNMGEIPGPPTCADLKQQLGADQVACQGVGTEDGYPAALSPNFLPKNTDDTSIAAATTIMNLAATKCPDTTMLVGGYSQGSAVMDNAIQGLPANMQSKIAGVVLFGYTRNAQDNAQVPGYPQAQTKIFCAPGDLVCDNTLTITPAHLSYAANAPEAATFLASMIQNNGTTA
ncbi:family 5 carbohydrate esterase [Cryphonectria parasitica EP155]|uniref:cutinase n=1 Tax=Cryphonectria parasitica (strain ATCC 38755 / EP155) TaxID=660469 RepID=A0A9P4Y519_CRYP1|nr:family 5 carbohydrate esterase [Cryphonectria parasitica EP155]KAF3766275.1 family 5 carbohydrate esterase [Cryphonectria parasitica EP155]